MRTHEFKALAIQAIKKTIKQGQRSSLGTDCKYRLNGLKCIAGQMITDEQYQVEMEDCEITSVIRDYNLPFTETQADIMSRLQTCHDDTSLEFRNQFKEAIKLRVQQSFLPKYCLEGLKDE